MASFESKLQAHENRLLSEHLDGEDEYEAFLDSLSEEEYEEYDSLSYGEQCKRFEKWKNRNSEY